MLQAATGRRWSGLSSSITNGSLATAASSAVAAAAKEAAAGVAAAATGVADGPEDEAAAATTTTTTTATAAVHGASEVVWTDVPGSGWRQQAVPPPDFVAEASAARAAVTVTSPKPAPSRHQSHSSLIGPAQTTVTNVMTSPPYPSNLPPTPPVPMQMTVQLALRDGIESQDQNVIAAAVLAAAGNILRGTSKHSDSVIVAGGGANERRHSVPSGLSSKPSFSSLMWNSTAFPKGIPHEEGVAGSVGASGAELLHAPTAVAAARATGGGARSVQLPGEVSASV
jgi:hypothetical protein